MTECYEAASNYYGVIGRPRRIVCPRDAAPITPPPTQPKSKIVIPDGADEIVEQVLTHASPTPRVEDVRTALVEALGKAGLDAATGRQDLLPAPQAGTDGTNIGVALAAPDEQSCLLGARIDGKVLVWRPSRVQVQPGELTCGPETALAGQGMRAPH